MKIAKGDIKAFIEDFEEYYVKHPERRCVNKNGATCYYNPENAGKEGISEGCAIGRHMTQFQKKRGDNALGDGCGMRIIQLLDTKILTKNTFLKSFPPEFLSAMQSLHDCAEYWTKKGLSQYGRDQLASIKQNYVPVPID